MVCHEQDTNPAVACVLMPKLSITSGSYSLIELEGSWRTVSYAADSINGFNAVVQRDPDITVKTIPVAAPLPTLYSVIAAAAPAAVTVHRLTIVVDAPLLRQPFISESTLAATNVVVVNSGLVGLGEGLGVRSRSLYGAQTVVALWQWQCCENSLSRAPSSVVPPRLTLLGFLLRRNRK
ncbi:CU01 protein, partial [Acromyrmex insinuator]